jgi:hypothetical protein
MMLRPSRFAIVGAAIARHAKSHRAWKDAVSASIAAIGQARNRVNAL